MYVLSHSFSWYMKQTETNWRDCFYNMSQQNHHEGD